MKKVMYLIGLMLICLTFGGELSGEEHKKRNFHYSPWISWNWEDRKSYYITGLRKGDKSTLLYAQYEALDYSSRNHQMYDTYHEAQQKEYKQQGIIWEIVRRARKAGTSSMDWLTQNNPKIRENVIQAVMTGLFNRDPRVRLVAINFLIRLKPDKLMLDMLYKKPWKNSDVTYNQKPIEFEITDYIKKTKGTSLVQRHAYITRSGKEKEKVIYAYRDPLSELIKLDLFLSRVYWIQKINEDLNCLKNIKQEEFWVLHQRIDDEANADIPLKTTDSTHFTEKGIRAILVGMNKTKNWHVYFECRKYLERVVKERKLSPQLKQDIESGFKGAGR